MSKHTEGPWKVCVSNPLMFGAARGNGSEPIGFVYAPSGPEHSAVGQYNRLSAILRKVGGE